MPPKGTAAHMMVTTRGRWRRRRELGRKTDEVGGRSAQSEPRQKAPPEQSTVRAHRSGPEGAGCEDGRRDDQHAFAAKAHRRAH